MPVTESLPVRYRPRKFSQLVGQDHIVTMVRGMMKSDRIPGAILLEGNTGSGKTTVSRLLHAYFSCANGNACGKCPSCEQGVETHPDFTNINCAADGGVDNIRSQIQKSKSTPFYGIRTINLDECHKLTGPALEALLVPLEEPPQSTIWVLCTTDPDALKQTIRNRCTRMVIKPLERRDIVDRLRTVAETELAAMAGGKKKKNSEKKSKPVEGFDDKVYKMIANYSNGSMREALSILEGVLFSHAGGADVNDKTILAAYVESTTIDLEKAAVRLAICLLTEKWTDALRVVRGAGTNARGLLMKTMYLVDWLLGDLLGTNKYVPYYGRLFKESAAKVNCVPKVPKVLSLMRTLVDVNLEFNRSNVGESFLLQAAIERYATE